MIFSNDLSIDSDHRTPRAHDDIPHADIDETDTLLGRRGTNSSTTTRTSSSSRVFRFGLAGFLLAFVALSSSTFLFLSNRGTIVPTSIDDVGTIEAQVAKEQRPSSHESSSSDNVLEVPTSLMNPSFRASETSATSSLPLVPIDSFFDNINGDWTKDGEKRVHMSRSPSSPTCTLNGESGPYPFGEYYCHRESTKSHPFCKSGPNDYCKCWIFPVCLKSNGKNCSKHKGRHQGCHVLIERPTGHKNFIIQDKLSETEWEIYNYSPDLSF